MVELYDSCFLGATFHDINHLSLLAFLSLFNMYQMYQQYFTISWWFTVSWLVILYFVSNQLNAISRFKSESNVNIYTQ